MNAMKIVTPPGVVTAPRAMPKVSRVSMKVRAEPEQVPEPVATPVAEKKEEVPLKFASKETVQAGRLQMEAAPAFGELMAFSGPAPELINGRLAMLGFVAAVVAELNSGESVLKQWSIEPTLINATFLLFTIASFVPLMKGGVQDESFGPFTPKAERLNGRAAMIGFAALLGIEIAKHSALF